MNEPAQTARPRPSSGASIRSVDRALDLLTIACSSRYGERGCSLSDCSKTTGLSPSTALRLLRALVQRGFLSRDGNGMFHPGLELLRLGAGALSRDNIIRIAGPVMRELASAINESVYLVVSNTDGNCLYIAIEECSQAIRHVSWVGTTFPAQGSAAGRALSGTLELGSSTVERGVVENDVTAISSPVVVEGRTVAAVSIIIPSYRADADDTRRYAHRLERSCLLISAQLGGQAAHQDTAGNKV